MVEEGGVVGGKSWEHNRLEQAHDSDINGTAAWSSIKVHPSQIQRHLDRARLCEFTVGTINSVLRVMSIINCDVVCTTVRISTSNPISLVPTSYFHEFLGIG